MFPALLKAPDKRSVWMTHDRLPGASGSNKSRKITREGSFSFEQTATLRMKLTFHPRRSLLLSPNLNVWRKKKKSKHTYVTTSAKQTCWITSKKALELLMHMHKLWSLGHSCVSTLFYQHHSRTHPTITVCARTQTMPVNECCERINLIWYNLSYTNTHTGQTK